MMTRKLVPLWVVVFILGGTGAVSMFAQEKEPSWNDPWGFHVNFYGWHPRCTGDNHRG